MKHTRHYLILALAVTMTALMYGQTDLNTMIAEWERAKAYTQEYLDAMPADKYNLKPTAEVRSFAGQMLHIADANYGLFSTATGVKSPVELGSQEKTEDQSKENVTHIVLASYDFIIDNLKDMTADDMSKTIKIFGKFDTTVGTGIQKVFEHQTHHRGQTTIYLRLAGVTPPAEKLF